MHTPLEVRETRILAGLTQKQAAERFSYALRSWQQKEAQGKTSRTLSAGEFELLQLLAGEHPTLMLVKRMSENESGKN